MPTPLILAALLAAASGGGSSAPQAEPVTGAAPAAPRVEKPGSGLFRPIGSPSSARPAPQDLWVLESLRPAANAPQAPRAGGLSLDAALAPAAPPAPAAAPSGLAPRLGLDRLSDLDDVVSDVERLRLNRPRWSGWRVTYSSDCGSVLRPGGSVSYSPFPRCLP